MDLVRIGAKIMRSPLLNLDQPTITINNEADSTKEIVVFQFIHRDCLMFLVIGLSLRSVDFWCHPCKLPKLFAQMTVAIKPTL